jgi:AraC family transcriptional regulator of adaptative response/methylated-DNA-[protein]-cysteine methyltransferase
MTNAGALPTDEEMYRAVRERDGEYDGIFFTAVKTTGIFCRPTCPAKKPRRENVEFFGVARDALLAGYRPCLRCRPLEPRGAAPGWLRPLLASVEKDPARRWRDRDLRRLDLDPARVRRWFQREHGMTFHAYLRSRRLGLALGRLRHGEDLTMVALDHGYGSLSGFRDAFKQVFGDAPGRSRESGSVAVTRLLTPLGPMIAGATDEGICLLEFAERRMLETQLRRLSKRLGAVFVPGSNRWIDQLDRELRAYFDGASKGFDIPLVIRGTEFQKLAWDALLKIPYGETRTYEEQARVMGRASAVRAVGRANGDNRIAIVIPCHRVIGSDGRLTGYGGGLWRKRALLELEQGVRGVAQPELPLGGGAGPEVEAG